MGGFGMDPLEAWDAKDPSDVLSPLRPEDVQEPEDIVGFLHWMGDRARPLGLAGVLHEAAAVVEFAGERWFVARAVQRLWEPMHTDTVGTKGPSAGLTDAAVQQLRGAVAVLRAMNRLNAEGRAAADIIEMFLDDHEALAAERIRLRAALEHISKHESGEWPLPLLDGQSCDLGSTPGAIARSALADTPAPEPTEEA